MGEGAVANEAVGSSILGDLAADLRRHCRIKARLTWMESIAFRAGAVGAEQAVRNLFGLLGPPDDRAP
jgi:hypothetical protein